MKYYLKENFHFLVADGEITDENGNVAYTYENQLSWFLPKVNLYCDGEQIGAVNKVMRFFGSSYDMYLYGQYIDTLEQRLKFIGSRLEFPQLGWSVEGNFGALHYKIYDPQGNLAAVADQEFFRMTQRFQIDIFDDKHEDLIILLIIAINQFDKDIQSSSSAHHHHHHH